MWVEAIFLLNKNKCASINNITTMSKYTFVFCKYTRVITINLLDEEFVF